MDCCDCKHCDTLTGLLPQCEIHRVVVNVFPRGHEELSKKWETNLCTIVSIDCPIARGVNVPLYEYRCKACGERFTRLQRSFSDPPSSVECPACGGNDTERVLAAPSFRIEGGGAADAVKVAEKLTDI